MPNTETSAAPRNTEQQMVVQKLEARLADATKLLETGRVGFMNRLDEAKWLASVSAWLHNVSGEVALPEERKP